MLLALWLWIILASAPLPVPIASLHCKQVGENWNFDAKQYLW